MGNNYSGNDSKFEIGLETTWGTSVTPTLRVPFLSESLKQVNTTVESDALVGAVTTPYYKVVGKKVEGDMSMQMHPDNIGELIYATLGVEGSPAEVEVDEVYTHDFTPVSGGTSLPHLTAVVDKKADEFTYTSLKVESMGLEVSPDSLLIANFSFIGQKEELTGATQSLAVSTLAPYSFNDMSIYFGTAGSTADTNIAIATSMSFNYSNNLENDLFTADGTEFMQEIDYQKRDITMDIETLYDGTSNSYRENYFKTGDQMSVRIEFTHPTTIYGTDKYKMIIDVPYAVITEAPNDIGGPDRLRIPLSLRALQVGSTDAVTIQLQDAKATQYSA